MGGTDEVLMGYEVFIVAVCLQLQCTVFVSFSNYYRVVRCKFQQDSSFKVGMVGLLEDAG